MEETRSISLKCGVCGNTSFEFDEIKFATIEDADEVKCSLCNKVYTSKELKEVNSTLIQNISKELAEEVIKKEFKKMGIKLK